MEKELEVLNEVNEINYDQNKVLEALIEGGSIIRALIINWRALKQIPLKFIII